MIANAFGLVRVERRVVVVHRPAAEVAKVFLCGRGVEWGDGRAAGLLSVVGVPLSSSAC